MTPEEQAALDAKMQKEMDELDAPSAPVSASPEPEKKPAAESEKPAEKPGVAAPVKDAPAATEKKPEVKPAAEPSELDKAKEQISNLNTALRTEREERRKDKQVLTSLDAQLKELTAKTKEPSKVPDTDTANITETIDPEVEKTLDNYKKKHGLISKEEAALESVRINREFLFNHDAARMRKTNADYDDVFMNFFMPECQKNAAILKEFQDNIDNPAEFAYSKGKEIMAKYLPAGDAIPKSEVEKRIADAEARGRQLATEELTSKKTIGSLSSVPGSAASREDSRSEQQKEMDEL